MTIISENVEEVLDSTYELGRQAGRRLVRVSALTGLSGLIVGSVASYFLTRRYFETKYNQIADEEIAEIREHYRNKTIAMDNTVSKAELEGIVKAKGYAFPQGSQGITENSVDPPMAITPPTAVVEAAELFDDGKEENQTLVVKDLPPKTRNVFEEATVIDNWDYHKERQKRSPLRPYVIHYDERNEKPYVEGTLTYYTQDDVLCNELDEVIADPDRERLVGDANLEKFGHGSNDAQIVYIRNDTLETQYEIVRSPNSYAKEVHGLEHADTSRRQKKRRFDYDE